MIDTFEEGSKLHIVTELVTGGELFDRIVKKTNYTEAEARDLMKVLLETLAYMVEKGVVHRNLKPENLLLCSSTDSDTDIKIADFSLARFEDTISLDEEPCGTPAYIAVSRLLAIYVIYTLLTRVVYAA